MTNIVKNLIATFRRSDATAADLAIALDRAREEVSAAEAAAAGAESAYSASLLDADDEIVAAHVKARNAATIRRDRAVTLAASLQTRLEETRVAEAAAALEAERKAVDAEAQAIADLIRTRYPKLATELVGILKRISASDRAIVQINAKLTRAERHTDLLPDVQKRGLPQPKSPHAMPPTIWSGTVLQEIEGFAPGWAVTPWNHHSL